MTKQQFMGELKQLLGELPVVEREEALNYYEEYFADAGEENEDSVIAELGSPEKVAFTIKAGLADADKAEGEFTDTGFKGYEASSKEELINTIPGSEDRGFNQPNNNRNNALLVILLLILLIPVIVPILCSVFGVLIGIAGACFGIMCALAVAGIGCIVAGAIVLVVGILGMATHPLGAIMLAGIALILVGIGAILFTIGVKIIAKLLPKLVRAVVSILQNIIKTINRKRGLI